MRKNLILLLQIHLLVIIYIMLIWQIFSMSGCVFQCRNGTLESRKLNIFVRVEHLTAQKLLTMKLNTLMIAKNMKKSNILPAKYCLRFVN